MRIDMLGVAMTNTWPSGYNPRSLFCPCRMPARCCPREICFNYGFTLSQCREASPCFNSCNGRGRCIAGICKCDPGGPPDDLCLSNCHDLTDSGCGLLPRRGVDNFAAPCLVAAPCQGFWGMDCALSHGPDGRVELLAGQGYVPRSGAPKVYVYELPPNMTSWWGHASGLDRRAAAWGLPVA